MIVARPALSKISCFPRIVWRLLALPAALHPPTL